MWALLLLASGASPLLDVKRAVDAGECVRRANSEEILVCGRRKRDERYRMPDRDAPFDPAGLTESVMREHSRWLEGGEVGIQSCGVVGPGGWTGCLVRGWARDRQQNPRGKNVPKKY